MSLGSNGGTSVSTFPAASARYVEMYGTQRATIWGYSMYEFQVYNRSYNLINNLSSVYFLKLKLKDGGGNLLSDNFYWCGTTYLDYTALNMLPAVNPGCTAGYTISNGMTTISCQLTNAGTHILFAARLKLLNQTTGLRVLPVIYSDNYFSLVPGEAKTVTLQFTNNAQSSGALQLMLEGWNTPLQLVLGLTLAPAVPTVSPPVASPASPVSRGTTVTLASADWTGTAPYSFQWQFSGNGAEYSNVAGGTTNSLVLPNVTTNSTGFYQLIFTANGQAVTSAVTPLLVSSGLVPTPRISVKFAADMGYGYDVVSSGWGAGALNSANWLNLYGPDGGSNGVSKLPFYTRNGVTNPSGAVLVYNYAGEANHDNEQAVLPNNLALMDSYIEVNNNCWYLSATNLDAPFTNGYSVYLYCARTATGQGGHNYVRYYAGQTTKSAVMGTIQWNLYTTTTNNDGHFSQDLTPANTGTSDETYGANYLVFTNLSGGAFDLLLTNGNGGGFNALEIVANPAATVSALSASASSAAYGAPVTLTNLVNPPPPDGESVTFMDGAIILGTGALSGGPARYSTSALAGGSHALTAVYGGDGSYLASTSSVFNLMVTGGLTLSAPVAVPSASVYAGSSVTLICSNFTGTPPYSFQWQASTSGTGYANVSGAGTNALTLANVAVTNAGGYQLVFGASGQFVTSSVAQLAVKALPVINAVELAGSVVLNWPAGGVLLQATNVAGPWATDAVVSPYTNQPAQPQVFYRVLAP